jgi:hypothetical protein
MLSFAKNKIVKITALSILIAMAFSFIHSELDQFSYDFDHNEHDYCDLVDGATLQLTKTSSSLLKIKIVKITSLNSAYIITKSSNLIKKKDFEQYFTAQNSTQLYIYNNTFLI